MARWQPARQARGKYPSRGFSLIELMIVVALIAILTAIAVSAYTKWVYKARRTEAKTALLDLAAREERFYTANNAYSNGALVGTNWPLGYSLPANLNGDYTLSVITPSAASATGATFTLQADPQAVQQGDACGSYTLDNLGNQGNIVSGAPAAAAVVAACW